MAHDRYSRFPLELFHRSHPLGHTTFTTMQSDFTTCLNNATSITAYLNIATSAAFLNIVCKVHIMMHVISRLMQIQCTYNNNHDSYIINNHAFALSPKQCISSQTTNHNNYNSSQHHNNIHWYSIYHCITNP